ncbi:MAG: hypothetical protein JOS17DRAFT_732846 [Linnemannia elongata]|nr:MAG: hypothetical protein JOS17DRAFT_732846 [Linnemannia elongata]
MNNVKEIQRLNAREATLSTSHSQTGSWHEQYKDSAHVFVGGLPYHLTEGDIICVVSQFGEVAGINLVRDKDTGKSKGYAFLKYVDQRSTILAVDNLNGAQIAGRTIRVDHVQNYKVPKVFDADGNEIEPDEDTVNNAAPKPIQEEASDEDESSESEVDDTGIDIDDPMREYLLKKRKKDARKAKRKAEKEVGKSESKAERKARKELKKAAKRDKDGGSGSKKSKIKGSGKDNKESSPSPSSVPTTAVRDVEKETRGGDAMDIDIRKEESADKTRKDLSTSDHNTPTNNETSAIAGSPPPSSSSRRGRPRSRSRSPRPKSRSRSNDRNRGRGRGRSQSRERHRDRSSRDDYNNDRSHRRKGSSRERREESRERRRDDSRDRKQGVMDESYHRRRRSSPDRGRPRSPDSSSRRRDYDRDRDRDHRGSRYRSRSRSPPPRRGGGGGSRRSWSRSPERT